MAERPANDPSAPGADAPPRRRFLKSRRAGIALLVVLGALVAARLALPSVVRSYVIRTLDRDPIYDGRVGDVTLHLWRGAYTIEDVRIVKTTGNVPVPFYAARRVDLAVEWPALLSGELVGRVVMDEPELNFVDGNDDSQDQTGAGAPWLDMLRDLFPFKINSTQIHQGTVHFRAFGTDPPVDVYLSRLEASIDDLTNIHEDVTPMIATVKATALAMDHAKVEYEMRLDPSSYRPTFHLAVRMLGLDVTKTNSLTRAYTGFDFEKGWLDLLVELDAKEGSVRGYVKPLYRDVQVIDLRSDVAEGGVLTVFWEALVGGATKLFENHARDQVATVIPLEGDLTDPRTDVLTIIGNLLSNAFVRAYLPRFQGTEASDLNIAFGTASLPDDDTTRDGK